MAISNVKGSLFQKVNGNIIKMLPETVDGQVSVSFYKGADTYDLASVIADVEARLSACENIDVFQFMGGVSSTEPLPADGYKIGWTYRVTEAGTYAGVICESGDTIYCQNTVGDNSDWLVVQANIDGAVTGPSKSVRNNLAVFDSVTGKVIKDSGIALSRFNTLDANIAAINSSVTALENHLEEHKAKKYITVAADAEQATLEAAATDLVDHGLIIVQ